MYPIELIIILDIVFYYDSVLICVWQVWRYVSYSMVHSGLFHVIFNILVQLVLGIPLEMVHKAWRVAAVYLSGVLAGSLWTSVVKPLVFLSGASGGVYALITGNH